MSNGTNRQFTRRSVLTATGGALAGTTLAGAAGAESDRVRVNVGVANDRGRATAERASDQVHREFGFGAMNMDVPRQALNGLRNNPNVRYVEEDGRMFALDYEPYGVDRVDADVTRANGYTGDGANVAVIDTGIDADHPDLQANLGKGGAAVACSGSCSTSWDDDNGHGTHCAGTVGAASNGEGVVGVAPEPTLHAVKVLDANGGGSYSDIAAGIEWTADQGWEVASLSLGGGYSSVVDDACQYAYDRGVLLVAAAGNSGPCNDCVGYPAALDTTVAVSATDDNDDLASFSSTGPQVELAAPGADVWSTYPGGDYEQLSGTSMACPHVSGAAALYMAYGYSNTDTRQRLRDTAEDIGLPSNQQGSGLLDAARLMYLDSSDN